MLRGNRSRCEFDGRVRPEADGGPDASAGDGRDAVVRCDGGHSGGGTDGGDRPEEPTGDGTTDDGGEPKIFHRQVASEAEEANERLLRLIANLENCDVTDLPPLYDQIDHMVEHLFTEPPPADAQVELKFTYHGYRIELDQSGDVTLMKVGEEAPAAEE